MQRLDDRAGFCHSNQLLKTSIGHRWLFVQTILFYMSAFPVIDVLTVADPRIAHVLYLEDQPGISSVIRSHLEKYPDIILEKVPTPEAAITRMRSPEFDALITNVNNPNLEHMATRMGLNFVSIRNHGKILPLHLCSRISNDRIIVEDKESVVEFSLHRRRSARKQFRDIIAYIHNLVIIRSKIINFEDDVWLLADVMEASKVALLIVNGNSFQWCNDQATKILGYSSKEIKNVPLSDLFQNRETYIKFSQEILHKRGQYGWGHADAILSGKNGNTVTCLVQMRRVDPMHPLKGHILAIRDFQDEKKKEEQIKKILLRVKSNEAHFKEALDKVSAAIIRTDSDGIILFSNQHLTSCLGYEPSDLLGKNIIGNIFPENSRFGREMVTLTNTPSIQIPATVYACQNTTRNGGFKWMAWNAIAVPGLGDDLEEMLFIGYDAADDEQEKSPNLRTNPWKHELLSGTGVEEEVFDAVFHICVELSIEGRENRHIGTAFTIGDSEQVLAFSRQCGINAYEGQDRAIRCIRNTVNREAIKGLAQLDGAFVVRGDGTIEASCRHFIVDTLNIPIPLGYGTRHSSMAGITQMTKAIGIVVSESGGTITIFRKGTIIKRFSL